jgi:hypothetical protein
MENNKTFTLKNSGKIYFLLPPITIISIEKVLLNYSYLSKKLISSHLLSLNVNGYNLVPGLSIEREC